VYRETRLLASNLLLVIREIVRIQFRYGAPMLGGHESDEELREIQEGVNEGER